MRGRLLFFLLLLLGTAPAPAGYSVNVSTVPGFLNSAGTIAVIPPACPPNVDCIWLNNKVNDELARYTKLKVVDSKKVGQAMMGLGITEVGKDNFSTLAQQIGADSLLMIIVGHSGYKTGGFSNYSGTQGVGVWGQMSSSGALTVSLVSAETGKLLMKGEGFGETGWQDQRGVLRKIFRRSSSKRLENQTSQEINHWRWNNRIELYSHGFAQSPIRAASLFAC